MDNTTIEDVLKKHLKITGHPGSELGPMWPEIKEAMQEWASLQTPPTNSERETITQKENKLFMLRIAELEKEVERLKGLVVSQFSSTWEGEDNFDELLASFKTENNL